MGRASRFLLFLVVLTLTTACAKTRTRETKSGRLNFVETLRYGMVGTHGSQGWSVRDRQFYVSGNAWSPPGINVNDHIANCEASPNPAVEALKCYSFADMKETAYVLQMKGDTPVWVTASEIESDGGDNLGEWNDDGYSLVFKDTAFNVVTSERKTLKGLPDYPGKYFIAASPDASAVVYREDCYKKRFDRNTQAFVPDAEADKRCALHEEHIKKGVAGFWIIDTKSGDMKMLTFDKHDHPWSAQADGVLYFDWLKGVKSRLRWEKGSDGKYELAYPK